jgi:hypothetical protein
MFEAIEALKREFTDQHVVVIGDRPELARFAGHTGRVKTVNMSGRALVQFDAWNNIGWYDIELEFLRIVPAPTPPLVKSTPAVDKSVAGRAAAAGPSPGSPVPASEAQTTRATATPAPAKDAGKPSTADILAAARAKRAGAALNSGAPQSSSAAESTPAVTHESGGEAPADSTPAPAVSGDSSGEGRPVAPNAPGGERPLSTAEKIALMRKGGPPPKKS